MDACRLHGIESAAGESSTRHDEQSRKRAQTSPGANGRETQCRCALGDDRCRCAGVSSLSMNRQLLAERISELSAVKSASSMPADAEEVVEALLAALESGELRA